MSHTLALNRTVVSLLRIERSSIRSALVIGLCISLMATLLVWGPALSSNHTISSAAFGPSVLPICRASPTDFSCASAYQSAGNFDPAPVWSEIPLDYFYAREGSRAGFLPKWNFYSGSGYPVGLDSHHGRYSLTRWYLRYDRSDQARDILSVARVLFFSWGVTTCLLFSGSSLGIALIGSLAATTAPFLAGSIDSVALDIDTLYPWFFLILLIAGHVKQINFPALIGSFGLGAWVGLAAFHQSQAVFLFACGVSALFSMRQTRGRSFKYLAGVYLGFLVTFPAWAPLLLHLSEFISSRSLTCISGFHRTGIAQFARDMVLPTRQDLLVSTLGGIFGIAFLARRALPGYALGLYATFSSIVILGAPWLCAVPGLSSARFGRQIALSAQFLFIYCVAKSIPRLDSSKRSLLVVISVLVLSWIPAFNGGSYELIVANFMALGFFVSYLATRQRSMILGATLIAIFSRFATSTEFLSTRIRGNLPKEESAYSLTHPTTSIWASLEKISQKEDRRHYSTHEILYPNWGAAFGVLDFRIISPLMLRNFHRLSGGIYEGWHTHPFHLIRPDRFVRPEAADHLNHPDLFRVLILNRVSLFTLPAAAAFPDVGGPYRSDRCDRIADDSIVAAFACRDLGGIAFFPEDVIGATAPEASLAALRGRRIDELASFAVIETPTGSAAPTAGRGKVLDVRRAADRLEYDLEVTKPGVFVIADNWFPGWSATINGEPTTILRANVTFKAISIPNSGTVRLRLDYN